MLNARSMQEPHCLRSAAHYPALRRYICFALGEEIVGHIRQRFETDQFLGHQNGPGVTVNHALAKKNRHWYRDTTFLQIHQHAKLAGKTRFTGKWMAQSTTSMVFLTLEEDIECFLVCLQLQSTHTAPATTPVIGFFEPFLLIIPDQIERVQSIFSQALRIILVYVIFQAQIFSNLQTGIIVVGQPRSK